MNNMHKPSCRGEGKHRRTIGCLSGYAGTGRLHSPGFEWNGIPGSFENGTMEGQSVL